MKTLISNFSTKSLELELERRKQETTPTEPLTCFCGEIPFLSISRYVTDSDSEWYVMCSNQHCGMKGPVAPGREQASQAWNTIISAINTALEKKKDTIPPMPVTFYHYLSSRMQELEEKVKQLEKYDLTDAQIRRLLEIKIENIERAVKELATHQDDRKLYDLIIKILNGEE